MVNPWLGIALIVSLFTALMLGLRHYKRLRSPDPEWVRKLLHIAMGLVALAVPWLFAENWPVIFLALGFTLFLIALRVSRSLKRLFGGVIDGVSRKSLGEICFPISVGLLFLLAEDDPILFYIPVLILTLSDAAAGLIGRAYGRLRFKGLGGGKSIEGSVVFLATAFLSTHIPLLLLTDTGRAETLLISLTLSLFLTLIEAVAARGLDNLLLPLGAFVLLKACLVLEIVKLAVPLGGGLLLVALFGFFSLSRSRLDRKKSTGRNGLSESPARGHAEGIL